MITTNEELAGLIELAKQAGFKDYHLELGTELCILPQLAMFLTLMVEGMAATADEQGLSLKQSN